MAVAVAAAAVLGCTQEKAERHDVAIRGFEYTPTTLTARVGDTITWTNADIVPHTATATDRVMDSGAIEPTESWRFVATDTGAYSYVCTFHPTMKATLVIR